MFSHAQKFAQESATPVVPAPLAAPDTAAAEVAGAGAGEAAAAEAPEAPRESAAERARRLEQEEREVRAPPFSPPRLCVCARSKASARPQRQEREVEEMQRRLAEAAARREAAEQHREHSLASMRQVGGLLPRRALPRSSPRRC